MRCVVDLKNYTITWYKNDTELKTTSIKDAYKKSVFKPLLMVYHAGTSATLEKYHSKIE